MYWFNKNNAIYLAKVSSQKKDKLDRTFENKVHIYLKNNIDNNELVELETWIDSITYEGDNTIIKRFCKFNGFIIKFINNKLINVDMQLNSKELLESLNDFDQDQNIGIIDIETFNNQNNEAIPYAIGYKCENINNMFYLDSNQSPFEMILNCIDSMLIKKNHNYKFYAHNMSEFDGIIILKSLMLLADKHNLVFNVHSDNEGKIISLDIV